MPLPFLFLFLILIEGGKDRRVLYNDGDSEDLTLRELQSLALLDPQVTKKKATTTSSSECNGEEEEEPSSSSNQKPGESSDATELRNNRGRKDEVEDKHPPRDSSDDGKMGGGSGKHAHDSSKASSKSNDATMPSDDPSTDGKKGEDVDDGGVGFRKSGRTIRAPRKVDEIYSYEAIKRINNSKKARSAYYAPTTLTSTTPERKARLLSSLDHFIPHDKAAESTLTSAANSDTNNAAMRNDNDEAEDYSDESEEENKWLHKVAVSLGANATNLRQKQSIPRPTLNFAKGTAASSAMRSDEASTCSTISCASDKKMPGVRRASVTLKEPPESVLVSHSSPSAMEGMIEDAPLSLLSEHAQPWHGLLVIQKNTSPRIVCEVILNDGSSWVGVDNSSGSGKMKKYRPSTLLVLEKRLCSEFKTGDILPDNLFSPGKPPTKASPSTKSRATKSATSPSEHKIPVSSFNHLFCWVCNKCDTECSILNNNCNWCKTPKTSESERSMLLEIAEDAIKGNVHSADEAMSQISSANRPSIPKQVVQYLLETKSVEPFKDCSKESFIEEFAKIKFTWEMIYYWNCGSCTMQNKYQRSTCSACLQAKRNLAERSPLLKIAEEAAKHCKTTEEALLRIPERERQLVPAFVMDGLVTCVFMIEGRNGSRRCRKNRKVGYDYCEAHRNPGLAPRIGAQGSSISSPAVESLSQASPAAKTITPPQGISAINEFMPSFLRGLKKTQVNDQGWTVYGIEDAVMCGEHSAFPLGMKVCTSYLIILFIHVLAQPEADKCHPFFY